MTSIVPKSIHSSGKIQQPATLIFHKRVGEGAEETPEQRRLADHHHSKLTYKALSLLPNGTELVSELAKKEDAAVTRQLSLYDHTPHYEKFEPLGNGRCVSSIRFNIKGRGGKVKNHEECRKYCVDPGGYECLGYTWYHCERRCVLHLTDAGVGRFPDWSYIPGDGTQIALANGVVH